MITYKEDSRRQVEAWLKLIPKDHLVKWIAALDTRLNKVRELPIKDIELSLSFKVKQALELALHDLPLSEEEAENVAKGIAQFTYLDLPDQGRAAEIKDCC